MMKYLLVLFFCGGLFCIHAQDQLLGAWSNLEGNAKTVLIFSKSCFSITKYNLNTGDFSSTKGGIWTRSDSQINLEYEFDSQDSTQVGNIEKQAISFSDVNLSFANKQWIKLDDGSPGDLSGAWLMTGRKRNGEMRERAIGPRKTMKILSGTRFQWIAYDSDRKAFMGTGGGTYTTEDGIYTENIEFFSRDNSRVGAKLPFNYELKEGKWHHSGQSSRGDPLYEVWSQREN